MTCPDLLSALRGHAAGAEATPPLAAHLRTCSGCAAVLETERRLLDEIDGVLAGLSQAEPSPALLAHARALAEASAASSWRMPALRAAAAFLVVGVSAIVIQRIERGHTPSSVPSVLGSPASPDTPPAMAPPPREARPVAPPRPSAPTPRPVVQAVVIVPPGQEALARRFAALIESGAVDVPPRILEHDEPDLPLPEPAKLFLPPLTLVPLEADAAPTEE